MVTFYKGILNKTYLYILINGLVWREVCSVGDNGVLLNFNPCFKVIEGRNLLFSFKSATSMWIFSSHSCVPSMRHPYPSPSNTHSICAAPCHCKRQKQKRNMLSVCVVVLCWVSVFWEYLYSACLLTFSRSFFWLVFEFDYLGFWK